MPGRSLSASERSLAERLADVGRDLRSLTDVAQAAELISEAAMAAFPQACGAGVTLTRRHGKVETVAATSDVVRRGDQLQYELDEGPCLAAAFEERQVHTGDLAGDPRWPRWGPRVAEQLGVRSMLCTQLHDEAQQLGSLNVYSLARQAFDADDLHLARLLAAHAAGVVAATTEIQTLRVAIERRTTIGKALGILMVRYDLDDEQAMAALRRLSSQENRKLYEIAAEVVEERRLPGPDLTELTAT